MNKNIKFNKLNLNVYMYMNNNYLIIESNHELLLNKIMCFELFDFDLTNIIYLTIKINKSNVELYNANIIDNEDKYYKKPNCLINNCEYKNKIFDYNINNKKIQIKINSAFFDYNIEYSNVYIFSKEQFSNYVKVDESIESNIIFLSLQDYYFY